ncbi:VOC family protein [Chryseolinea lacunae]|uniref:VOC domain-containing protein n=1 Tax=Chryseolinea lacunae TaxID=2801331 RepID=A0ABS1KM71_9BACT|nr:VOC family protein [Chryseolinea lacunae]MBL0740434.1 hypothetical protein [Chryseolinea lacunae]
MQNRTMPTSTVIPVLAYPDLAEAIDWLTKAFGFSTRWTVGDHRAQLSLQGGTIAVTKQPDGTTLENPAAAWSISIMIRVVDVDAHHEQARLHNARVLHPPIDFPYGERQYSVMDFNGYVWTFSQSIQDLRPEDWGGVSVNL